MNLELFSIVGLAGGLLLAPAMGGVLAKTKALLAGRRGAPIIQPYFDLSRLLRKGMVRSELATNITNLAPLVSLSTALMALLLIPLGSAPAVFGFSGDFIVLVYLLGLGRFATVLGALDSGSSFQGMGASRELTFSALAEPALLVALLAAAWMTDSASLTTMLPVLHHAQLGFSPAVVLTAISLGIVVLAENSRLPVDDPNTHLELTMIHEVMVLDYSGPDLAFIHYGAALKLWLMSTLLVNLVLPETGNVPLSMGLTVTVVFLVAILIGLLESSTARLKLKRVPQFIVAALVLAILGMMMAGVGA